jgi:hypothetical protein
MRAEYEDKLNDKTDKINRLTDENIGLISDLTDRDTKHNHLE